MNKHGNPDRQEHETGQDHYGSAPAWQGLRNPERAEQIPCRRLADALLAGMIDAEIRVWQPIF
jgi:hypothetical protein